MANIVLGVSGGIAAYKACELLRLLTEAGHRVQVVPTAAALRFVGAPTWAALSGRPVAEQVWSDVHEVPHVRTGQAADLLVVAPATADLLARAAAGIADDLLTNTLLTVRAPVLLAPAMHTEMWEHPATAANVATLRGRGVVVLEPATGRLAGSDTGKGRLPDPPELFAVVARMLDRGTSGTSGTSGTGGTGGADLAGRRVVVTAGGTREPLDPVRFLGNRSTGKQGYALARTALARGATVRVVAANVELPDPAGAEVMRVETTEELRWATVEAATGADVVVMAAAPCDFRPAGYAPEKIKKSGEGLALQLVDTVDVAAELGAAKPAGQVLVVFAAETAAGDEALANARAKLIRKGADLAVLNEVGADDTGAVRGFGADTNAATVLGADGSTTVLAQRSKDELANAVWDLVKPRLTSA